MFEYEQAVLENESIDDIFAEVEDFDDMPIISVDGEDNLMWNLADEDALKYYSDYINQHFYNTKKCEAQTSHFSYHNIAIYIRVLQLSSLYHHQISQYLHPFVMFSTQHHANCKSYKTLQL